MILFEIQEYRDQRHVFNDRFEAGEVLADMLRPDYASMDETMVLAIPAGGVPIGLKVKGELDLPLDLMIARKLKIPGNPEAGFGAMALGGTVFLNERILAELRLTGAQIEYEKRRISRELAARNRLFRQGRPLPDLAGKRVILVDDGLASGFTMLASVDMARKAGAGEIIVAIPTAPLASMQRLSQGVDKIYCANIRTAHLFAVAEAYRHWYDLDDKEVQRLLGNVK